MNLELIGKTALISGSTKGIGFAIASQLAAEGARVILNGHEENGVNCACNKFGRLCPRQKSRDLPETWPPLRRPKTCSSFFSQWTFSSTTSGFMSQSLSIKFPTRIG